LRVSSLLRLASGAVLVAAWSAGGCKVDDDEFQNRVFRCDTSAADPLCGTDADGQLMECFAARQIGASDFCAQTCGDPSPVLDRGMICVQGHAKLKACNPHDEQDKVGHPNGACDRAELGCLRTDVLPAVAPEQDQGVCLTMNTCDTDQDCHDPVRSTCAATFFKQLYAKADDNSLHADNLYCLQEGCDANHAACSPGETCLRTVIPPDANPPDICVPNCDSQANCPPNHFCLRKISGPANPAVCIPGLLGFVCGTDLDCLAGKCLDDGGTGADNHDHLNLCTALCQKDADCAKFDGPQGVFLCNQPDPSKAGHCATPLAYRGASCDTDADCVRDEGSRCARVTIADVQGVCLHPCADDFSCLPRGGINHTCVPLQGAEGTLPVCFPGNFGFPCFSNINCTGDLSCRGAVLDDPANPQPGICTALCADDKDCASDRWIGGGWCGVPDMPFCLPPLPGESPCASNAMCASGICDTKGSHKCVGPI
jgi:hypothetical protein